MEQAEHSVKAGKRYYLTERGESYLAALKEGQQKCEVGGSGAGLG